MTPRGRCSKTFAVYPEPSRTRARLSPWSVMVQPAPLFLAKPGGFQVPALLRHERAGQSSAARSATLHHIQAPRPAPGRNAPRRP